MEIDQNMIDKMTQMIQQSSNFDELEIVERKQIAATDIKFVQYDTLTQALQQFIQIRPSDEKLLSEDDYLIKRKIEITENLTIEIKKIENLIPEGFSAETDYSAFKKKQGNKMIQHVKKIFPNFTQVESSPEKFLAPFLIIYRDELQKILKTLLSDKDIKNKITNQIIGSQSLQSLGSRPKSTRIGQQSVTDEKKILEDMRRDISKLEMLVFKMVIAIERVNYYTMGVILPRDQNLRLIPFFETQSNLSYDFQSCLQICSLIKNMIERQEQIERQLSPYSAGNNIKGANVVNNRQSFYFDRNDDKKFKEKHDFRDKFESPQMQQRCLDIWHEFSEEKTEAFPRQLKVHLLVKLMSLAETFANMGFKITIQLFPQPGKPHSQQKQVSDNKDSWLFTELNFAETLLKDDLILIIKVYSYQNVAMKKSQQKVNPNTNLPMEISLLKAFAVLNISDIFFNQKMKDGKSFDYSQIENPIRFYQFDLKWSLEQEYFDILSDINYNQAKGFIFDEKLTKQLNLKLQFCLISSITRNQLSLRLDQAQIVRERNYWYHLVRPLKTLQNLNEKDPLLIYSKEIEQLNFKELKKANDTNEFINQMKISINSLQCKDKAVQKQIFRIQVFLIEKAPQSQNLNYKESFFQSDSKKLEETFQTVISGLNKKGFANFRQEVCLRVPQTFKTKDFANYRLLFFVYMPIDNDKVHSQITELMIEQEKERYSFYPVSFAKVSLLSQNGLIVGGHNQEISLQLIRYTPKKYLNEQMENETDIVQGSTLQITLNLISQQYSTDPNLNLIFDAELGRETQIISIVENQEKLTNSSLLIYYNRIIFSLLHLYNSGDKSNDMLVAIMKLFDRINGEEFMPYKQLIINFEDRWRGDPDSDKKLLQKLKIMLAKIPESIIELFSKSLDLDLTKEIKALEQKLLHLPAILALVCKLFTREFNKQYASIREKINTFFRKWMEKELCTYRPDLTEGFNDFTSSGICSKPAIIIQMLEQDMINLNNNYKVNAAIKEELSDDEPENENDFSDDDDFQFVEAPRPSLKRDTFHNAANLKDTDIQIQQLQKMTQDIKIFQQQFCGSIKQMIRDCNMYLHEDIDLAKDDPEFQQRVNQIIEIQKNINLTKIQKDEHDRLIAQIYDKYIKYIKEFPKKVGARLLTYHNNRKDLRRTFWGNLQDCLHITLNFIDKEFVFNLFNEKLLLRRLEPVLDQIVETCIPKFQDCTKHMGTFYKAQQEYIASTTQDNSSLIKLRDAFENMVKDAQKNYKLFREEEQKEIEKQVKAKVQMLSDLVASDTFILLPREAPSIGDLINQNYDEEQTQEKLVTKISLSVFHHLKQYKNQFKDENQGRQTITEKFKDTTQSELQYLFLYKMQIFEKKFLECSAQTRNEELQNQNFKIINQSSLKTTIITATGDQYDDDQDILGGLSTPQSVELQNQKLFISAEEIKESRLKETNTQKNQLQQSNTRPQGNLNKSMQMLGFDLGAQKDHMNLKDRTDNLYKQFEPGTSERRICFYLNEMEDSLSKYWELKDNVSRLSINELALMKKQHISLFSVLSLQQLSLLTPNAFKQLYQKRPGCLDRLVKQVRSTTTTLEFGLDEFFFNIKKLQVIEQFCRNVIEILCDPQNKKNISELQDKYTYKSIVSQVWVLQLTLLCEQAQVLYDFVEKGQIYKTPDPSHEANVKSFKSKLKMHLNTQMLLWSNYKEIDDMILPDENTDLYTGIQGRIIKVLQVDLDDSNIQFIEKSKLSALLEPLARMFVQIDELTYKTQKQLSYRVFVQIDRLLKEFVDYSGSAKGIDQNQRQKKKQICDAFVEEYRSATQQLQSRNNNFQVDIKQRCFEITQINKLYQQAIKYEKFGNQEGNLLAQLISYYEVMQLLQEKNLSTSFQNNIKVKYKNMIENINTELQKSFEKDKELASIDLDFICQKQPSQYVNQMKEVKAFMYVEDYYTYKGALDKGLLKNTLVNNQNVKALETIIDQAVQLLVQSPNQFFDKALELLSDKRALQESNYDFSNVIKTLDNQISHYKMYENFKEQKIYCNYYRIKIEAFLPEEMKVPDRYFVYRTPSGYNQEFIKHDIGVLLNNNQEVLRSKDCDVKPLQPLTSEVRQKYQILTKTENLFDTPEEVNQMCPPQFEQYFKQNFKRQFYVEQCPSLDPAGFEEEYVITIYEVKKTFPTMTMIQQVYRQFERKIPRVKIELYQVKKIINDILNVLRRQNNQKSTFDDFAKVEDAPNKNQKQKLNTLEEVIQMYITNDDVGGGFPKMLDLFFNDNLAEPFSKLENRELKRSYLELFKGLDMWLSELNKVVEVFSTVGRNVELTKLAEERLEDRGKVLDEKRKLYKLHELQENF